MRYELRLFKLGRTLCGCNTVLKLCTLFIEFNSAVMPRCLNLFDGNFKHLVANITGKLFAVKQEIC